MSDRALVRRAVVKAKTRHDHIELKLACGHRTSRPLEAPPHPVALCPACELELYQSLHREPLPHLRLTHYGL